jgi:hypothetical protein
MGELTMPEVGNIVFSFKEVVIALLKAQGIHEGTWALFVRFGLNAVNAGANEDELKPTAIIPILELGLQKAEKESSIAVDAAKANPQVPTAKETKTVPG